MFANDATAEIHAGSRRAGDHQAADEWQGRNFVVGRVERCADDFDKKLVLAQGRDAGNERVIFENQAVFQFAMDGRVLPSAHRLCHCRD